MKRQLGLVTCLAIVPAMLAGQTPPSSTVPNGNAAGLPRPAVVEGQPVETRPPEKTDNKPAFPQQTRAPYHATAPFKVTTLIDHLHAPWSLAFLPGRRCRHRATARHDARPRQQGYPVRAARRRSGRDLCRRKDIGLLDVVLNPGFPSSHRIFFTYCDIVDGTNTHTYSRGRPSTKAMALTDVKVIFRAHRTADPTAGGKPGAAFVIGRDGTLFVTIGDRSALAAVGRGPAAGHRPRQDHSHHRRRRARRRRIRYIGVAGALPEIWAYGARSEEGLAFDPRTGRLWETEHGPRGGDELNLIEKGKNYGWPVIVHGIDYPGTGDRRRHHAQGGHGGAGLLLGSGDRALRPCLLYRQPVSAMEEQRLRRRACAAWCWTG